MCMRCIKEARIQASGKRDNPLTAIRLMFEEYDIRMTREQGRFLRTGFEYHEDTGEFPIITTRTGRAG